MRILFLATNGEIEASTRYRVMQFFPALRAAGHEPELSSVFPTPAPPSRAGKVERIVRGYGTRLTRLVTSERFDVVVVHRELLPFAWNELASWLGRKVPLVYDLDDAVWLASQHGWRSVVSRPASTRAVVRAAQVVFAGNDYIAEYARQYNRAVEVIPTVVDTDVYRPREAKAPAGVPLVGWIGSPTTARYLELVREVLDEVAKRLPFRVRIVGAGKPLALKNAEVETPPWSAAAEPGLFAGLDIGIYPLVDDPWSRGKCGFKAIQYMASGVPCVVSPVGVVRDIVRHETEGLWANSPEEWAEGLSRLLTSAELRARLAQAGRARAVANYSVAHVVPRVIEGLERARATWHSGTVATGTG